VNSTLTDGVGVYIEMILMTGNVDWNLDFREMLYSSSVGLESAQVAFARLVQMNDDIDINENSLLDL